MQVGSAEFDWRRRMNQKPINPLDKSTVVSIYPKHIHETKPTIQPGVFDVPAGSYEHPSILVVGSSSWWREIDEEQPMLEIPVSSVQIAESIVRDWANGLLACNMTDLMPGVFSLPGAFTHEKLLRDEKIKLDTAQANQRRWFQALVKIADVMWSRSNGNPLSIDDNMRMAARELGLNKEWLADFQIVELVKCIACGSLRNPLYPVCPICKAVVDTETAKKLNIQFAS